MSQPNDPFRSPNETLAAPIVWTAPAPASRQHPWSAPDPFAEPQRPAPPTPVTQSQIDWPQQDQHDQQPEPAFLKKPEPEPEPEPVIEQFAPPVPTPAAPTAEDRPADDDDVLTIGRGRGNSIVLDDMLVSRHHVRITADDDGLVLQDLGSRNGTFVNGDRVQSAALHEGDLIGIGSTTFEVRDGWLVSV
ncbi:MAG: FHA domain-containing protein [Actinomycetota bacterium]|nr:FHA domain-containing protein [Actinomycetota bacterium]